MSELETLFDELWPIYRSLTGEGNRQTLRKLSEISKINELEVPSGSKVFDWTIPPEYTVNEAYIADSFGNRIIDFKENNLHLVSYSNSINAMLSFDELKERLHFLEHMPEEIPYVTSYYEDYWGFCLSYNKYKSLNKQEKYHVYIDSVKDSNGSMTLGERFLPGQVEHEVLISTYICHPSLANNELSGPLLTIFLQRLIEKRTNRYFSYRFVYVPETIGAICILEKYGEHFKKNTVAGFVVTCVGDSGKPTYKKSRRGDTLVDRLTEYKLKKEFNDFSIEEFFPTGSDERQYCSPYFNLPIGSLMRTRYGKYKEYHTSADNKSIMDFEKMEEFVDFYDRLFQDLELIKTYYTVDGKGEPFLRRHDLHQSIGAQKEIPELTNIILWALNMSTGEYDTLDIAKASGADLKDIWHTCELLCEKELLSRE
jgi:aminopeptidase-like protein